MSAQRTTERATSSTREAELLAGIPNQLFIGGAWVDSTSGRAIHEYLSATYTLIPNSARG